MCEIKIKIKNTNIWEKLGVVLMDDELRVKKVWSVNMFKD